MKENIKKYDIKIEETLKKVVSIEATNINDAINKIDEKIYNEEIILTADDYSGKRIIKNNNSKKLDKPINFFIHFNPEDGVMTILQSGNHKLECVCETIEDFRNSFNTYIDKYMEEPELEVDKNNDIDEIER